MASSSNTAQETTVGRDVVGVAGALIGLLAALFGTFVELRPNRILFGEELSAIAAPGMWGWALVVAWGAVLVLALIPGNGRLALVRGLTVNAIAAGAVAGAAIVGAGHIAAQGEIARLSLGGSFWLTLLACYIVGFSVLERLETRWSRVAVSASALVAVVALGVTGVLDSLGITQEFLRDPDGFWQAFGQQVAYTLGATAVALVVGLALGVAAARSPRLEAPVFTLINVLQVLPTLSFIGLLIVPMSWLGSNVAFLDAIGVSGIGWAPVFVVLCAYAVYPITRNTFSAIKTLDTGIVDAARGVGMRPRQRLVLVELPLAVPVVLAGVRVAAVQTAAAAIIAGLVGGGGLGQIVFYGLQQTATDLMLLGVIPIVALALTLDATLRGLQRVLSAGEPSDTVSLELSAA